MAISNSQIIQDALGLLGVLQETEVMSAEQGAHGLRVLNELMADWKQDGIDLQYYEQTALADPTPVPDHATLATKYYLAMALAPYYARPVAPEFVALGSRYYDRLVRDAMTEQLRPVDMSHLPIGEGWANDYDIERGS